MADPIEELRPTLAAEPQLRDDHRALRSPARQPTRRPRAAGGRIRHAEARRGRRRPRVRRPYVHGGPSLRGRAGDARGRREARAARRDDLPLARRGPPASRRRGSRREGARPRDSTGGARLGRPALAGEGACVSADAGEGGHARRRRRSRTRHRATSATPARLDERLDDVGAPSPSARFGDERGRRPGDASACAATTITTTGAAAAASRMPPDCRKSGIGAAGLFPARPPRDTVAGGQGRDARADRGDAAASAAARGEIDTAPAAFEPVPTAPPIPKRRQSPMPPRGARGVDPFWRPPRKARRRGESDRQRLTHETSSTPFRSRVFRAPGGARSGGRRRGITPTAGPKRKGAVDAHPREWCSSSGPASASTSSIATSARRSTCRPRTCSAKVESACTPDKPDALPEREKEPRGLPAGVAQPARRRSTGRGSGRWWAS